MLDNKFYVGKLGCPALTMPNSFVAAIIPYPVNDTGSKKEGVT